MKIMLEVCNRKSLTCLFFVLAVMFPQYVLSESLFLETSYRGLVNDAKASHIGDSITVLIVENSKAESTTEIDSIEASDNSVGANNGSNTESLGIGTDSKYRNSGEVARTGKLVAKITVTIHEILPTGELRVKGEQNIQINDEVQEITLSGNIRPMDVNADNTILSTRIANAQITYKGEGYISDDEPGVITQFFRWLF